MKAIKGKKSFYSKKLEKVIHCINGYYDVKTKSEIAEVEKYLKSIAPKKVDIPKTKETKETKECKDCKTPYYDPKKKEEK